MDTIGKLLFPSQWFDFIDEFINGYARVKLNGKWNFISRFSNGYAKVELNGKQKLIYTNGNITS